MEVTNPKQKQIAILLERDKILHQKSKKELSIIFKQESDKNNGTFGVFGEMVLFTADIAGFAVQVIRKGYLIDPHAAIENLQKMQLLDIPYFHEWYFSPENTFITVRTLFENADYLRLLLIEFARNQNQ